MENTPDLATAAAECARLNALIDWELEYEHIGVLGTIQLFDKP